MSVIDDYLRDVTSEQRTELERVRRIVRQTVPGAQEVISYGMPAFKYQDAYLVGFCAFKDHLGFYPTPEPIAGLKDKLKDFKLAKGTIQFTPDKPIPEALLKELIIARMAHISAKS